MNNFTIQHGPVSNEDALRHADALEAEIGAIVNGKRKPGQIGMESISALIQFARDRAKPAAPAYTEGHCAEKQKPGGCQLHNLHCGYPKCDRRPA